LIIAKFGGTSVANTNSIKHCIEIIKNSPRTKIVVVSAQSGVTNLLVQLATQCNDKNSITQVSNDIHQTKNISARVFSELTEYNIRLFSHGASGHNICLLVDKDNSPKIIRKIYDQFFNLKRSVI
ncbi:UNVERIFIED_CONTAM: hypothetical protein GTU68_062938, partial [Idotea baltica]|nr:hypothetical protein [Idotea baltica]